MHLGSMLTRDEMDIGRRPNAGNSINSGLNVVVKGARLAVQMESALSGLISAYQPLYIIARHGNGRERMKVDRMQ